MLKIGLTGGIGSGKSLVGEVFKRLGIPIFNADNEAKHILNSDKDVISLLKNEYGEDIYLNNQLNRKKLAAIIFNNPKELQKGKCNNTPQGTSVFHRMVQKR